MWEDYVGHALSPAPFTYNLSLMHASICTRAEFDIAIYVELTLSHINELQSVVKAAARLIGGMSKFDHISIIMWEVLWY